MSVNAKERTVYNMFPDICRICPFRKYSKYMYTNSICPLNIIHWSLVCSFQWYNRCTPVNDITQNSYKRYAKPRTTEAGPVWLQVYLTNIRHCRGLVFKRLDWNVICRTSCKKKKTTANNNNNKKHNAIFTAQHL